MEDLIDRYSCQVCKYMSHDGIGDTCNWLEKMRDEHPLSISEFSGWWDNALKSTKGAEYNCKGFEIGEEYNRPLTGLELAKVAMMLEECKRLKDENKQLLEAISEAYEIMSEDSNPCMCDDCLVVKSKQEKWLEWFQQYFYGDKSS